MKTALIKIKKNEKESFGYADIFTKDDEKNNYRYLFSVEKVKS